MPTTSPAVDLERLGGLAWVRRTGGVLTLAERRRLLGAIGVGQGAAIVDRLRLLTGRVPASARAITLADLTPPDSALAREAEAACAEQSPAVAGHAMRTWAFGRALAALDRTPLDAEAFWVAALVHDHGLEHPVAGEDFTIRSAARAAECVHAAGGNDALADRIGDAISAHATPGATVAQDGPLGTYVQAGAVLDLVGLRAGQLTPTLRREICERWDRTGITAAITALIAAEVQANPAGRFALLNRCGFSLFVRAAPLTPR